MANVARQRVIRSASLTVPSARPRSRHRSRNCVTCVDSSIATRESTSARRSPLGDRARASFTRAIPRSLLSSVVKQRVVRLAARQPARTALTSEDYKRLRGRRIDRAARAAKRKSGLRSSVETSD
jgi:hypothetical protein